MLDKLFCNPDRKYLVYDCETCHLNLAIENFPWQHSWLVCQDNKILKEYDYYVNWPNLKVSQEAARISHFNPSLIQKFGKEPEFVLNELESYLYNEEYFIIISNGLRFDIYVIAQHQKYLGRQLNWSFLNRIIDPVALMKGYKLNIKKSTNETLLQYQFRLHNLKIKGIKTSIEALCKENEIQYDSLKAHSAIQDCYYLFQVWQKIKYNFDI